MDGLNRGWIRRVYG